MVSAVGLWRKVQDATNALPTGAFRGPVADGDRASLVAAAVSCLAAWPDGEYRSLSDLVDSLSDRELALLVPAYVQGALPQSADSAVFHSLDRRFSVRRRRGGCLLAQRLVAELGRLASPSGESIWRTVVPLGAACLPEAEALLISVLECQSLSDKLRGDAAEALRYPGYALAEEVLLSHLADPSPEVRFFCVYALGQRGNLATVDALRTVAEQDQGVAGKWGRVADEALDAIRMIGELQT